jgi:hypothetical protein
MPDAATEPAAQPATDPAPESGTEAAAESGTDAAREPAARGAAAEPPPSPGPSAPPTGSPKVFLVLLGLVLALVAGYQLGTNAHSGTSPAGGGALGGHSHAGGGGPAGADLGGLAISSSGYTLAPESTVLQAGVAQPLRFRIIGPDGRPVSRYLVTSERQLHLIVVRRDLTGYQHLHPTLGADGVWSVPLTLPTAGSWRAFADFAVPGPDAATPRVAVALGADLTVAGDHQPAPPAPVSAESTVDGYRVTFGGAPQVGSLLPVLLRVYQGGRPVTELEQYLGSYGHLVVLREGDLGYLHVHPEQRMVGGGVRFWLAAPSSGRFRAFFDFQVGGVVRTATFTFVVP